MGFLSRLSGLFLFLMRVSIGVILLSHGVPKLMNIAGFLNMVAGIVGTPLNWVFGIFTIAVEVLGGVALVTGLKTRLAAVAVAVLFFGIAFVVHMNNLMMMFNLNPADAQTAFEYPFLIAMASLVLASSGGGKYAKD